MEWQRIETAPKDGTCVLLYANWSDGECGQFVGSYVQGRGSGPYGDFVWKEQSGSSIAAERIVSHWMPLPAPPTTQAKE